MQLNAELATDLAARGLTNIAREYPNHPQYLLESDADAQPPRIVHPVFFGCFDWHSAVHTHWLLVRLLRCVPDWPSRGQVEAALDRAFTADKISVEAEYLARRPSFERPYGLAWVTLLIAEAADTRWAEPLAQLAAAAAANVDRWLHALRYPVRTGTHNQTAFALTLLHDAGTTLTDRLLVTQIRDKAAALFGADTGGALHLEPSGEDFLSPTLMEADLLRRVLAPAQFAAWLEAFLPHMPRHDGSAWLPCAKVSDETDGRWVHLHGLNLSRAWNLANIAAALPRGDTRVAPLRSAGQHHRDVGLGATLAMRHYAGDHWLPSFAVYLLTGRSSGDYPH